MFDSKPLILFMHAAGPAYVNKSVSRVNEAFLVLFQFITFGSHVFSYHACWPVLCLSNMDKYLYRTKLRIEPCS